MREIVRGKVYKMHVPQIQCLLEIFDLETAHYVQYRPPTLPFRDEILDIVELKRDRSWFASNFHHLEDFIQELCDVLDGKRDPPGTLKSLGLEDAERRKALKRRYRPPRSPPALAVDDLGWSEGDGAEGGAGEGGEDVGGLQKRQRS